MFHRTKTWPRHRSETYPQMAVDACENRHRRGPCKLMQTRIVANHQHAVSIFGQSPEILPQLALWHFGDPSFEDNLDWPYSFDNGIERLLRADCGRKPDYCRPRVWSPQ